MKVNELVISHSVTINLGNYESEKVEISQRIELTAKDDVEDIRNSILKDIRDCLYAEEQKVLKSLKKRPRHKKENSDD